MNGDSGTSSSDEQDRTDQQKQPEAAPTGKPVKISAAHDFDPLGDGAENGEDTDAAVDGDASTSWPTASYIGNPRLGNLKDGVGLILDLGKPQQVSSVEVTFRGSTSVDFLAAAEDTTSMPGSLEGFSKVSSGSGEQVELRAKKPITTRYVLVWLTELPMSSEGNYRGRIAEVEVRS